MADYRAMRVIGEAIMGLLESNYRASDFNGIAADLRIFTSCDTTSNTITNGASLFMCRLYCNGTYRNPPGRIADDGHRSDTQLPLELHFVITVWGGKASYQYELTGWIMRLLEDTPILLAAILNSTTPNVLHSDETVDIRYCQVNINHAILETIYPYPTIRNL